MCSSDLVRSSVNVISGTYTRAGYEFVGWSYKDSAGNTVILQPSDTFSMPDRVSGTKLVALCYGSVQNAEIHLFASNTVIFRKKFFHCL